MVSLHDTNKNADREGGGSSGRSAATDGEQTPFEILSCSDQCSSAGTVEKNVRLPQEDSSKDGGKVDLKSGRWVSRPEEIEKRTEPIILMLNGIRTEVDE
jgi:hypothetical protein